MLHLEVCPFAQPQNGKEEEEKRGAVSAVSYMTADRGGEGDRVGTDSHD